MLELSGAGGIARPVTDWGPTTVEARLLRAERRP